MLKVGIVGIRGLSTLIGLSSIENVFIEALCDIDEQMLKFYGKKYGIKKLYRIYDDMLESDINVVIVATPMQDHFSHVVAALEAGKHVLCEVTAGVTMDELWWLIEAVEQSGKTYMMAENYCYMPEIQLVSNMVDKGMFGELYYGEGQYLHNVRGLTKYNYNEFKSGKTTWRKYWQLGKRGCFYPTHSIGPLMQWFKGDRIESIACFGSGRHTDYDFRQDDTCVTLCQLESGKLLNVRLDCISNRPHNLTYYQLQGTKACYEAASSPQDVARIAFVGPDGGKNNEPIFWEPLKNYHQYSPERYRNATEQQLKAGHDGGDYFIIEDFITAIRTSSRPKIDVYDACEWTAVALLSELSITNRGRVMDMPNFRKNLSWNDQTIVI